MVVGAATCRPPVIHVISGGRLPPLQEAPMSDQTRTRLLYILLALSAVLALAGAGLATYVWLKG